MSLVKVKKVEEEDEQIIKPEAVAPNLNTSDWPLLLKNWDQRKFLTNTMRRSPRDRLAIRFSRWSTQILT